MSGKRTVSEDDFDHPTFGMEGAEAIAEEELWFLPGPAEAEPDFLVPGPHAEPSETEVVRNRVSDWVEAERDHAARLARVAGRLGALDDRLWRGPAGWRHRLALIEAADLSWFAGDRVGPDRLALWLAMRLSGVQMDQAALIRVGWAFRRLSGGPGPRADLPAFLDRRDPDRIAPDAERFEDRSASWLAMIQAGADLHPITCACMGYHLWAMAGLGEPGGGQIDAAVTAARVATGEACGMVFAPLAMGGAGGMRVAGTPSERLGRWLDGMTSAIMTATRHLDEVETWEHRAIDQMARLSGRTPAALRRVLTEWPLISAPMAEALTGASRAAVQRNLLWMQDRGLIHEVTGQGRYRMWRIAGSSAASMSQ
ncbi:hypothetical protein [Oceanicola sp. S124]|uniref:hypothetical protein n=1 Tax=Oceanicola sp. S124 TaxID=1042378 RepID=UPI000494B72F